MADEEQGGFFLPLPFIPDPETLRKMREAKDHEQMVVEDYHHGVARLLDGLDKDQLLAQKSLLHVIASNTGGKSRVIPAYYEGIVVGMLSVKHGVCIGCDHNHDDLMQEQMQREAENEKNPPSMDGGNPYKPSDTGKTDLKVGEVGFLSDQQLANMNEYGLDDLRSADDSRLMGFVCMNCGLHYVSIEDRMMKPADKGGCSGCVQKEQWG